MYKKGDYVVYRRDVCIIRDIKESKLKNTTYYVMNPIDDSSLIIDIPIENKMGFLRDVISTDKAKKLIERIPKINPIENINEKNLDAKYKEMLYTGNYEDLIKIIKTTFLRNESRVNNKKKISEKDNNYFKLAEKYLYNELSVSLNMSVEEVKDYIFRVVNK
jgi:transcriptional regulator, carD family